MGSVMCPPRLAMNLNSSVVVPSDTPNLTVVHFDRRPQGPKHTTFARAVAPRHCHHQSQAESAVKAEYLTNPFGDTIDNPTYDDILRYIGKIQEWDEEHAAFWVGMEDDFTLEVHHDLTIMLVNPDDVNVQTKAKDWEEVSEYFRLFLAGNRDFIK